MIEFAMPSLGADMEDGILVEWRMKPGDLVTRGDIIAEVETQKGLIEIEIFEEGRIEKILVSEGQRIPVGTVIALINPDPDSKPLFDDSIPASRSEDVHPIVEVPSGRDKPTPRESTRKVKATPVARRLAEEHNMDLQEITGTGEDGVITLLDVQNALSESVMPLPGKSLPSDKVNRFVDPGSSVRFAIAAAMSKSNREIPHYYLEKVIDMGKAMDWLNEINKNLSVQKRLLPAALLIKATALSLRDVPELNGVWDDGLKHLDDINIGFVVSLRKGGIIVPAIHRADLKTVEEIMDSLNDLIPRSRAFKLRSSELSDSTFTLTSIGEGGADTIFGIIYPPQVGIAGFGNISNQPCAINQRVEIRPIMRVTLAGDHRATDGLTGSRFLVSLNNKLQNPDQL
jgi:pyruvate dehydrogenase E2 component (dihydrolipoamide acetyltransferase)